MRPAPLIVVSLLILCLLAIPVSAETIIFEDENFYNTEWTSSWPGGQADYYQGGTINAIGFKQVQDYHYLKTVVFSWHHVVGLTDSSKGFAKVRVTLVDPTTEEAVVSGYLTYSIVDDPYRVYVILDLDNPFSFIPYSGTKTFRLDYDKADFNNFYFMDSTKTWPQIRNDWRNPVGFTPSLTSSSLYPGKYEFYFISSFKNALEYSPKSPMGYDINLIRNIDGNTYPSTATIVTGNKTIYNNYEINDITLSTYEPEFTVEILTTYGKTFTHSVPTTPGSSTPGSSDSNIVTVYVKNSQTGALIADANIVIDGLVNGEYYTVVNRTEPSGIFSITLQPTGGGQPNPDGYRLIATADGYNNPMPEINFTVDDYKTAIYCLLDPIAGGPVNENKTFIDFFVRDMSSNPISGATVKFGKYTLITNSQGYAVFEVEKNNNYAWTISKSGYGALTGNAVIGDAPRHTINTVLAPAATPTKPTPIPTSTSISPTPTMTAPTGEPVSNWLEWFAAHFGMILGGGAEIGKIFMWLCFAVPVGVYVGKEAKAGAAGFMAGAGVVTLFFVLIGWVPIWLLVLLALIIGLLYAKVLNTPDNGGGR